jgi:CBS domain-containing protein
MSQAESHKKGKGEAEVRLLRDRAPDVQVAGGQLICADWMTAKVHTVRPLDSVAHARSLLEQHRINQLPVVKDRVLIGIVTDRDLRDAMNAVTTSALAAGDVEPVPHTPEGTPIETVMSHNVIALSPHSSVVAAAELMRRERIGSVPIVRSHELVGIITRSDILKAFVARENSRAAGA